MSAEQDFVDYYALLKLDPETATQKSINRAYRLEALRVHPDKNPDNPEAEAAFHTLTKAFEILSDPEKKASYDSQIKSRLERAKRDAEMNAKRREMSNQLFHRETVQKVQREQEQEMQRQRIIQIEKLRMDGMEKIRQEEQNMILKEQKIRKDVLDSSGLKSVDPIDKTIKFKWKSKAIELSASDLQDLVETKVLGKSDSVETVIMKKNGLALICMKDLVDAHALISTGKSFFEAKGLQVDWASGKEPIILRELLSSSSANTESETSFAQKSTLQSDRDYESLTFMKMRQAQERKRLREAAIAAEEQEIQRRKQNQ